ncbi:MAG TPA: tryptophan synthase subunit beta, partial [Deltaproteobacteria bacterium]|nr:tryptophan synthase subunit beta [Deltaproteobacteria bacterium]
GPEHAPLRDSGRIEFSSATDDEALDAFHRCSRLEGILPALESSHALAWLVREAGSLPRGCRVLLNLSGRGDKDVRQIAGREGVDL